MAASNFDPRNPRLIERYGIAEINDAVVEGSTQSYKAGELVAISAGVVTVAATAIASAGAYGIALIEATGTSAAASAAQVIREGTEIDMLITDASGSAAAHTNCTESTAYDLLVTSGVHSVNYADTSKGAFVFLRGIDDAAGAATTRGRFKLLLANTQAIV